MALAGERVGVLVLLAGEREEMCLQVAYEKQSLKSLGLSIQVIVLKLPLNSQSWALEILGAEDLHGEVKYDISSKVRESS